MVRKLFGKWALIGAICLGICFSPTIAIGASDNAKIHGMRDDTDTSTPGEGEWGSVRINSNRELKVEVGTALPTGTNNIGDVDVLTLPNIGTSAPTHYNVTLTNADTEYSQAFTNAKSVMFQCRGNYEVRYAFVTGKVATPTAPYFTLKEGRVYSEEFLDGAVDFTLYIACGTAGQIVEIEVK